MTRTATGTVTRGESNTRHQERLAARRVAVVQSVGLVDARTVRVTVSARVTRRAITPVLGRILHRYLVVYRMGTRGRRITVTSVTRVTSRLEGRRTIMLVTVDTHPTARLVGRTFLRRTVETVYLTRIVTHLANTKPVRRVCYIIVRARARTRHRCDRT